MCFSLTVTVICTVVLDLNDGEPRSLAWTTISMTPFIAVTSWSSKSTGLTKNSSPVVSFIEIFCWGCDSIIE